MKTNKLSSLILALFLVGCNTSSISAPTHTQNATALTFTLVPTTNTPLLTETTQPLPSISPSSLPFIATPTQSQSSRCSQTATTQTDMSQCSVQQTQEVYAKLKSLITELQGYMSATQYATLLKVEADWEKMILEHCKWEAAFFEGVSIQPMWFSGCLGQQYTDRIEALRINFCEGHGMTGECEESLKYKN